MNKKKKIMVILLPLLIIISFFALKFWAQEDCVEYLGGIFTENFNTEDYKDIDNTSIAYWPPGPISLNWLGGDLQIEKPSGMGSQIYVCDAGDFDADGYPDLIGLDITDMDPDPDVTDRRYVLILVRNTFEDLTGEGGTGIPDGLDDDGVIFQTDESEIYEGDLDVGPASITTGDYNNDGLLDFFFYKNDSDNVVYDKFVAAMYINTGTATDPDFSPHYQSPTLDFTTKFQNAGIYCRWSADHLCSVDIDKDGDVDVLVISQNQILLVRNPGPSSFDIDNFDIVELNYDQPPGFDIDMGGSTIDAADFDNDEDIDIVAGSVADLAYIVFYKNDGTGYFTRHDVPIPNPDCIGAVATCVGDFNQDGWIDLMLSNDQWRAGNWARMWMYKNNGRIAGEGIPVDFEFVCLNDCETITPAIWDDGEEFHDVDMGISVDFDLDGDIDWIFADANHSGDYYLARNDLANVYTTYGEAWSTNISGGLDPDLYAITKAEITNLRMKTRGKSRTGLKVEFYLSNNDGQDWEFFQSFEENDICNQNDLPVHTFTHFGSKLRWKAILSALEDPMEEFSGASFDTPLISEITFEYTLVDKREYTRTSVVVTNVEDGDQQKKYLLASTFYFPTWEGHLRAYDISAMTPENTALSVLRTVSRPDLSKEYGRDIPTELNVNISWDAGELLDARSAASRTVYTATPVDSVLTRIDFTASNVDTLGPILQDVNNENEGLINFVRGEGRAWKLGDSNHSNPVVVGPPDETPTLMGDGYQDFMTTWADRRKVVYVGANDGMLHCFDVLTGEELWGFIPYNLLPKLKNMWAVDGATGERYSARDIYVDGSPMIADVYIDVNRDASKEWTTILISGQGSGNGSGIGGGTNYYFALDITDPDNPQPLWEFTDSFLGETWSVPVVGKIRKNGDDAWFAFMGSGYDDSPGVGNVFYAVDAGTGEYFWSFSAGEVDTTGGLGWDTIPPTPNIPNSIPGSPSIVDIDQDGHADRVYFADLDGRVWKVDVSIEYEDPDSWGAVTIYEDSRNYPIISKPAVWINYVLGGTIPRLYFGTGGDDRAPSNATYSFIVLLDAPTPGVEWYLGDPAILGLPEDKDMGILSSGERVWADPKVADYIVYFSTLTGSIDSVDPCESVIGVGRLYARFVQTVAGSIIGQTAFTTSSGSQESIDLAIKTRAAVTFGERERTEGGTRKREVYIQEYDSTIQKLEQSIGAILKIKSWREVYRVIR